MKPLPPNKREGDSTRRVVATGGSMLPIFPKHALITIRLPVHAPNLYDIVCIKQNNRHIIHRIIRINRQKGVIQTKGDNTKGAEKWTSIRMIEGVVESLTCHGHILYPNRWKLRVVGVVCSWFSTLTKTHTWFAQLYSFPFRRNLHRYIHFI